MTKTFRQAEPLDPRAVDDFLVVRASDGAPLYRVMTYPAAVDANGGDVDVVPTSPPLRLLP